MSENTASQDEGAPNLSGAEGKKAGAGPVKIRIVEGTMIGVVAGIMVGLIGWLSNELLEDRMRQEQIGYLQGVVLKGREEFYKDVDPHPIASRARIRALRFKRMETDLRTAMERRSTHVPYDRLYEIEGAFGDVKTYERSGPTTSEGISCVGGGASKVNIEIYVEAYRTLEKALDLPEMTDGKADIEQSSDKDGEPKTVCEIRRPVNVMIVGRR